MVESEYVEPVTFTKTGQYGCGPEEEDDVYTVQEFISLCSSRSFTDYDGFGYPVKDNKANPNLIIKPSCTSKIPPDSTHIVWYNR